MYGELVSLNFYETVQSIETTFFFCISSYILKLHDQLSVFSIINLSVNIPHYLSFFDFNFVNKHTKHA